MIEKYMLHSDSPRELTTNNCMKWCMISAFILENINIIGTEIEKYFTLKREREEKQEKQKT